MSTQFCKQLGWNIQTQETHLCKRRRLLAITKKYINKISFNFNTIHTVSWSPVSPMFFWAVSLILKLGFVYSRLPETLGVLQSGVNIFSVFIFVCFWGGYKKIKKKTWKSDWCFIEFVCLRFVWLHLMFPVAFLFCPHTHTPLHHFRSGCQSALLIFKGSRAWNRGSEHGPDFHSLIFSSHFPLSQ